MNRPLHRPSPLQLKTQIAKQHHFYDRTKQTSIANIITNNTSQSQKKLQTHYLNNKEQKNKYKQPIVSNDQGPKSKRNKTTYQISRKKQANRYIGGESVTQSIVMLSQEDSVRQKSYSSKNGFAFKVTKINCEDNQMQHSANDEARPSDLPIISRVSTELASKDFIKQDNLYQSPTAKKPLIIASFRRDQNNENRFFVDRSQQQDHMAQSISLNSNPKRNNHATIEPVTIFPTNSVSKSKSNKNYENSINNYETISVFRESSKKNISDSKIFPSQSQFSRLRSQQKIYATQKKKPNDKQGTSPTVPNQNNNDRWAYQTEQQVASPCSPAEDIKQSIIQSPNSVIEGHENIIFQLFKQFESPRIIKKNKSKQEHNSPLTIDKATNNILKMVANLGKNKSSEQIEKLRNIMKNQKNLKLRDYLRLASLSNDARFDNYKNSRSLSKNQVVRQTFDGSRVNEQKFQYLKKSSLFNKSKLVIDPQKSITLIKRSLRKKLQKSIDGAIRVMRQLDEEKELIGQEYEDLVFMCNLHRIFDDNMFKAVDLLEDIFNQYKDKRIFHEIIHEKEDLTEEVVYDLLSPRKNSKKTDELSFKILQDILVGLKIIKQEDIPSQKKQHV